ncbi:hypothetical protein ACFX1X_002382 [Malus domestica]
MEDLIKLRDVMVEHALGSNGGDNLEKLDGRNNGYQRNKKSMLKGVMLEHSLLCCFTYSYKHVVNMKDLIKLSNVMIKHSIGPNQG